MSKKYRKTEQKNTRYQHFISEDNTEVIHLIKAGRDNQYFVVHDDAWEQTSGNSETLTATELNDKYGIIWNE